MSLVSKFKNLIGLERKSLAEPDAWLTDLFGATPSAAGINVSPRNAVSCAPVRAAIAAISEPLGTLPVHVYRRTADGKERAPDHPLYRLLHDQANDFTPASRFRELMTADALLHNGGFAFIARNSDGAPISLHRLDPCEHPVTVKNDPFEGPVYEIHQDSKSRVIPRENILHLPSPSLSGKGLVHDARDVIGLALSWSDTPRSCSRTTPDLPACCPSRVTPVLTVSPRSKRPGLPHMVATGAAASLLSRPTLNLPLSR